MKPVRFSFCVLFLLAAFGLSATAQRSLHPMPRRANIILIVADGLAAGDLSCYGQTQFQTPNLDRLAAGGIRFTNYLAGGISTSAARAALMTGKNTSYLPDSDFTLTPNDITIAEILKNSGYHTGLIGEWDLGDQSSQGAPWLNGFQEFAGYFDPAAWQNVYPDYVWRYMPTFDLADQETNTFNGREMIYLNTGDKKGQYVPDSLMVWTINFTKNHAPNRNNRYRPFFLVVNETIPGNGYREVPTDAPYSEESWPQSEKNRAATIARFDDDIGELLDHLNQEGQASNTVIFVTSDTVPKKGGGVDPQFFHENSSADDLHVPLIVYWPGKIPAGQVSGIECSAKDFLPTAAAVALIKPLNKVDGVSLMPALLGRSVK
jgi:arylsulfatase A-like enzyme